MKKLPINHSKLLNIRPGNIIIENFIPGKIYRRAIEIENASRIPIIINLKASDKSKLLLNKSLLRLDVREKQIIELIIQDTINYQKAKYPIDPKLIYINITGELIETKFIITLNYIPKYHKNNEINNYNTIQINNCDNESERQIPSVYLLYNQKSLYNKNFLRSRKLLIDKVSNLYIQRYENNRIISLKNEIKNLMQQNYILSKKNKIINLNNPKNYKIKSKSLFFLGNKLDDPEHKLKLDNEIEIKALRNKNEALLVENNILNERIKDLENLLLINNIEDKKYKDHIDEENEESDINNEDHNENEIDNEEDLNEQGDREEMEIMQENNKNNFNYYDEFFLD